MYGRHTGSILGSNKGGVGYHGASHWPTLDYVFDGGATTLSEAEHNFAAITLTRASSDTHFDSSGVLRTVGSNVAAFDHDPVTGQSYGLQVPAAATNILVWSNDGTNWVKRNAISVVAGSASDGPDGTSDYTQVSNVTGLAGNDMYQQQVGYGVSTRYEPSIMIRQVTTTGVLRMQAPTGDGSWNIDLSALSGGWEKIDRNHAAVTINTEFTSNVSGGGGMQFFRVSGATPLAFDFSYANTKVGTIPTPLIKTTTAAASRAATSATIALSSVPGFSATEGTVLVECRVPNLPGAVARAIHIDDGTTNNRIALSASGGAGNTPDFRVDDGGVNQAAIAGTTLTAATPVRMAMAWSANDIVAAQDGGIAGTDTSGTIPTGLTTLRLGVNPTAAQPLQGTIARLVYWNRRLPDAQLQALTA